MPPSSNPSPPKALIFDIGGVCVASPLQAILTYEISHRIPPGWINTSISKTAPSGYWHKLERGEIPLDSDFFAGFNRDLHDARRWKDFYVQAMRKRDLIVEECEIPRMPVVDGEGLFWEMMKVARTPDPWMVPALLNLKRSGKFLLAALSNTVIFPPDHEFSLGSGNGIGNDSGNTRFDGDPRTLFNVFISSAHVGLRKPSPEIYQFTLKEVNKYAKEYATTTKGKELGWEKGIEPADIVFLDDIGENLKAARKEGWRTIKVNLGRAFDAVTELEEITGLQLAGEYPKVAGESRTKL